MQRSFLMQRVGVPSATLLATGKRLCDARFQRPSLVVAASRPNWRAEIEGGSGTAGDFKSNGAGGVDRSNGKVNAATTATLTPPQPAAPAAAAAAAPAAPPAPPKKEKPQQPPAAAAAAPAAAPAPSAAAAAEGTREEPLSLPTFDLMDAMADGKNQATAFGALAGTSAILAALCLLEPQAVLDLVVPKADTSDLDVTFVRIIGVTLAASGSVEYSLKHAAESQLLQSATYQRLMAGCAAKSVGFLAVLLATTPATFRLWSPLAYMSYLTTAVVAGGINLAVISHTSGKGLVAPQVEPSPPQNLTSWGYTVCVALYLLTALACFAPETLFTGDPYSAVSPLVKGVWAPGFLLAAVMSYVLKDAADRGRLGASTFKNLNLGLAALEYGYSIVFGSAILSDQVDIDLPALSNLGGALFIATFALYTYATAKK